MFWCPVVIFVHVYVPWYYQWYNAEASSSGHSVYLHKEEEEEEEEEEDLRQVAY